MAVELSACVRKSIERMSLRDVRVADDGDRGYYAGDVRVAKPPTPFLWKRTGL